MRSCSACRVCFSRNVVSTSKGLSYRFFQEWSLMENRINEVRKKTWMLWCLFLLSMWMMGMVLMKVIYRLW